MKTFREFLSETYLVEQTREDAERKRLAKDNPDEWRVRKVGRKGEERWTTKRKGSIKGQGSRRRQKLRALTYKEILDYVKRNLKGSPAQLAKSAQKIERDQKAAQTREARDKTKKTGIKHVVDHQQPQQDKRSPKNRERFERISPGDVSSNRTVVSEPENLAKGSKPPKKGEPGYGTTRSGAIKKIVDKA
jgi:phage portal protein BeeE